MLFKIDDIDEVCAFGNRILQLFLTASISAGAKSLEDVSLGRGSWLDVGPSRPIELNPSFPALAPGFDPFSALALGNAFRHPLPKFSQAPPSPPPRRSHAPIGGDGVRNAIGKPLLRPPRRSHAPIGGDGARNAIVQRMRRRKETRQVSLFKGSIIRKKLIDTRCSGGWHTDGDP